MFTLAHLAGVGQLRAPLLSWGQVVEHPSQALLIVIGILWVLAGPQNLLSAPGEAGAGRGNPHFVPSHWSCVVVLLWPV